MPEVQHVILVRINLSVQHSGLFLVASYQIITRGQGFWLNTLLGQIQLIIDIM